MAQFRPFAITQTPLSLPEGTVGVGNIVIGVEDQDYNNLEGLDFSTISCSGCSWKGNADRLVKYYFD